ncbi:hypothetical protein HYC85_006839 [Camellia sinensis]|uniref:Acyl-CoA oxidase/dehydrogenase middle domain-containing protein n=1 Tax=Camellia sinensis TaxID=4442 RepID=A0A7J7HMA5_CAMSI|nr:hypothetical protein HYC85_006839 [Camellia sinensis]
MQASPVFLMTHSSLAMKTIALAGSETQKQKYLPSLAQLKTIGSWGLTEPGYGSDASSLKTTATKVAGGWILEGQKRWIANSTFADVLVIFARNTITNQINGFLVKKDAPGLQATKIENKIGLRMVQNGDILLKKVFVPDEDKLPGITSFRDTNKKQCEWNGKYPNLSEDSESRKRETERLEEGERGKERNRETRRTREVEKEKQRE